MPLNSGQVIAAISAVALSLSVQDPSGIIADVSDKSRSSSCFKYRRISVSEWCRRNTGWMQNALVRERLRGMAGADLPGGGVPGEGGPLARPQNHHTPLYP